MAQRVDVNGTIVEFPDGMSQEAMAAALTKLPKTGQAPAEPSTPAPVAAAPTPAPTAVADQTGAAFGTMAKPFRRDDVLKTRAAPIKVENQRIAAEAKAAEVPFEAVYKDPANLQKIMDYGALRFGKSGKPAQGETSEDYVKRFMTHMRLVENNELNYFAEKDWLNSVSRDEVLKAGEVYDLFKNVIPFTAKGGQPGIAPVLDYLKTIATPSTVLSLGASKLIAPAAKAVGLVGLPALMKPVTAARLAAVPVIEGGAAATQSVVAKKTDLMVKDAQAQEIRDLLPQLPVEEQPRFEAAAATLEKEVAEGVGVGETAAAFGFGATFGLIEPIALAKASTKVGTSFGGEITLESVLAARRKTNATPGVLRGDDAADEVVTTSTSVIDGRSLLDKQGDPTTIAQMQIKNSIDKQADLLAEAIWKQMPELRPVKDEQVSDAVKRTFQSFDSLPDDVITSAFLKADVNQEQFMADLTAAGMSDDLAGFAEMYKTTTSDAARILQSKSVLSRMENTLRRIDKEAAARVDKMFGKTNPIVDAASTIKRFVDTVDKNIITGMTLNASTILRNAFAGTSGVTFDAAEEAIESTLFSIGNKLAGKPAGTFTGGIQKVTSDTISTYYYLGQAGLSKELTEKMLENSPSLLNKMLLTTAEAAKSDLYKPVQILATPAVIMDTFVRRAVFSSSVERSLRQAGLDMYDVLAQGKNIPIEILQRGVDDAIAFTFSKQPTGPIGSAFVKIVEATRPVSTTLVPFARFMVNATNWTMQHYNPGVTASLGAVDLVSGISKLRKGDDAAGYALLERGTGRIAKQVTGAATVLAAYAYRAENQDTPWNEVGSAGVNADVRFLFPLSAPMAIGDFAYKFFNGRPEDFKARELFETLVGLKIPAGMTKEDTALDALLQASIGYTSDEPDESVLNRMKTATEKLFGNMFGRMTVPMNQVSDVISAFSTNEAIPRDAFALREGEDERSFLQSVGAQIQRGIPILKQGLPESQSATREVIPLRETGMLKQATGLSLIPPKNQIEAAIAKYNVGYRDVFVTTGDRTVDAKAKKILAGLIPQMVIPTMEMDAFKDAGFDAQANSLKQSLRQAQAKAKDTAIKQSIQEAYSRGKVPAIEQKMFEKIGDAKLKRDVLKLYKDSTGESLYTSNDFMRFGSALEMAKILRKQPLGAPQPPVEEKAAGGVVGFAAGGSVNAAKLAKEILGTSVGKSGASILKEAQDIIKKKASVPATTPVAEQMKAALPLPKAKALPAEKPLDVQPAPAPTMADEIPAEPAPDVPEAPMARQMEETMPTPTEAVPEAPISKQVDEYDIPEESIKFPDNNTADDFTDVDYNEDPTNNLFKDYSDYTEDILSKDNDVVGKTIDSFKGRKKLDDAIATVRKEREDAYSKISGSPDFLDFDPIVVSTALAKTREKVSDRLMTARNIPADKRSPFFAPEFDIENASAKEVDDFFKLASTEQKKLDQLRAKFETRPPVSLIHGQEEGTDTVTKLAKKGFMAPQGRAGKHAELNVGAPSFTKDPNINALIPKFGGADVKAYGSVNIPYGDYIYRRINMPASVYDEANPYGGQRPESALFTYNRAITGAPDDAVPISLPKGYHLESEDIFLEADKLKAMGFSRPSGRGGDKEALFRIQTAIGSKGSTLDNLSTISDTYAGILDKKDKKRLPSEVQVYSLYKDIRNLFKNEIGKSESVGVTGGAGSRYVNTIRGLATAGKDLTLVVDGTKYPITDALKTLESELDRLATRKNNTVLTEKADNIRQLRVSLENISKQTEGTPSAETISATSFRKGSSTDKIDSIKAEMAKLDQKISKEWDVDVIDDLKLDKEILQDRINLLTKAIVPSERTSKDKIMKLTDKLARGGLATRR